MNGNQKLFLFIAFILGMLALRQHPEFFEEKNQNFFLAIVVAFIGSAAGAWGGAYAIEQRQKNKFLSEELKSTQVGIILTLNALNAISMIYSQEVEPLTTSYKELKKKKSNHDYAEQCSVFPPMDINLSKLSEIIYHRLTPYPRALTAFDKLEKYLKLLQKCAAGRCALVEELYSKGSPTDEALAKKIKDNSVYEGYLSSMHTYAQHCLFYAQILYKDLYDHAKELHLKLKLVRPLEQYSLTEEIQSIMPDVKEYEHFLEAFPK